MHIYTSHTHICVRVSRKCTYIYTCTCSNGQKVDYGACTNYGAGASSTVVVLLKCCLIDDTTELNYDTCACACITTSDNCACVYVCMCACAHMYVCRHFTTY